MNKVSVSRTFQKQFNKLPGSLQAKVRAALVRLKSAPLTPGAGLDLKPLKGTKPLKQRLRVGEYRIIIRVEGINIFVIEIFPKGRGYRL